MGSHSSAIPANGYVHGNNKPFFNPNSSAETTIRFALGNTYTFPDAIMYYLVDCGTLIDHEGKFPTQFVQDVLHSSVSKKDRVQHRGVGRQETGPKARGECKPGDIGYCEQVDVDNPLSWQAEGTREQFALKLLSLVPELRSAFQGHSTQEAMLGGEMTAAEKPSIVKAVMAKTAAVQGSNDFSGKFTLTGPNATTKDVSCSIFSKDQFSNKGLAELKIGVMML